MAFWGSKAAALFIIFNILFFFTCVPSLGAPCPPKKSPKIPSSPKKPAKCPKDTLKFGACTNWLGLVGVVIGTPPSSKCCALVAGLADFEAALCFCSAIKANVLGVIKVNENVALTSLVNACGKKVPKGFVC